MHVLEWAGAWQWTGDLQYNCQVAMPYIPTLPRMDLLGYADGTAGHMSITNGGSTLCMGTQLVHFQQVAIHGGLDNPELSKAKREAAEDERIKSRCDV